MNLVTGGESDFDFALAPPDLLDTHFDRVAERGLTLVPTRIYFKDGRAKVELALARGKEVRDKRRDIADRESKRRIERAFKSRR